jgi:hypothetical protein
MDVHQRGQPDLDQFRYLVFKDPEWEVVRFDAQVDLGHADDADDG